MTTKPDGPIAAPIGEASTADMIRAVQAELDADIFSYVGDITARGHGALVEVIFAHKRRDAVILILVTNGGSGNAAYQIARVLQKFYKKFYIYIPSYCKSAGTMLALGAHHLFMSPFSELGPLDVQLLKQNELGERKSGLLTKSSFEGLSEASFDLFETLMLRIMKKGAGLVSFRVAAELSANMTGALMSQVYGKFDHEVIGSDRRDLEVALHYGIRLIEHSQNAGVATIDALVNKYPAHDFIIDDTEARRLFENVTYPPSALMALAGKLSLLSYDEEDGVTVMALTPDAFEDAPEEDDAEDELVPGRSGGSDASPDDAGHTDGPSDPSSGGQEGIEPKPDSQPANARPRRRPERRPNGEG